MVMRGIATRRMRRAASALAWAAGAAGFLAAPGCLLPPSPEKIQEELALSRQEAYEIWKRDRDGQQNEALLRGPLSLEDAIKAALQYNKALLQTVEQRGVARGRVIEAYQLVLPSATFTAGYEHYQQLDSTPWQHLNKYSTGLTISQPLGQGASIPAAQRTARLWSSMADEQVRGMVQNVIYQTATAYYSLLLAQHLYEANRQAVLSAEAHLRVVENKQRFEVETKFAVLRTRVDLTNFRVQMTAQQNAIDMARIELLKIIGVNQESEIVLTDELTFEPMKPVFERAVEMAFTHRSDLHAADLAVGAQREAVRLAQSQWWPQFGAFFTESWAKPDPQASAAMSRNSWNNSRWVAGVQGSWTLAPWATAGQVAQQKAELRNQELARLDAQETAIRDIQQAIFSVANAEELVRSQQLNCEAADEALRLASAGYEAGKNAELDVIQARSAQTTAISNYYSALHSHAQARLSLQIAMGILGPRAGEGGGFVPRAAPVKPGHIAEFAVAAADFEGASPPVAAPIAPDAALPVPTAPSTPSVAAVLPVLPAEPIIPSVAATPSRVDGLKAAAMPAADRPPSPAPAASIPAPAIDPATPPSAPAIPSIEAASARAGELKVTITPVTHRPPGPSPTSPIPAPVVEPAMPPSAPAGPRLVAKVTVRSTE